MNNCIITGYINLWTDNVTWFIRFTKKKKHWLHKKSSHTISTKNQSSNPTNQSNIVNLCQPCPNIFRFATSTRRRFHAESNTALWRQHSIRGNLFYQGVMILIWWPSSGASCLPIRRESAYNGIPLHVYMCDTIRPDARFRLVIIKFQ